MRGIKIGPRLAVGFGLLALILLLQGLFGLNKMSEIHERTEEIHTNWIPALTAVGDLNLALMRYRVSAVKLVVDPAPAVVAEAERNLRARLQEAELTQSNYEKLITGSEDRAIFAELLDVKARYILGTERILVAMKAGNQQEAVAILEQDQNPLADRLTNMLSELGEMSRDGAAAAVTQSEDTYGGSKVLVSGSICAALFITVALAMIISRSIEGGEEGGGL